MTLGLLKKLNEKRHIGAHRAPRVTHSFLNEFMGLLIAALIDCHAIVAKAILSATIPASMNTTGPIVIR